MPRFRFSILSYMSLSCFLSFVVGCALPSAQPNTATAAGTGSTAPVETQPDPTGPGIFNVKLAPYSAKGDGVTDDTRAIRAAIGAACNAGGGEVYLPKGTYIVSPQDPSEHGALIVPCDSMTLTGAGMGVSVISRKTIGDSDPDKTCPLYNGQVNRAAGIYVAPKLDGDQIRHSFHMSQLSLLGNRTQYTGMNGHGTWPATPDSCFNMWDISDKGVYVQVDHDTRDIVLDNVEVAYFSGELFYGGSQNSAGWQVTNSNFHHSNGDGLSYSAGTIIQNNSIHDVAVNGIENMPYGPAEPQDIEFNTIYNTGLDGIGVMTETDPFYTVAPPAIEVANNNITHAKRNSIVLISTRDGNIHDNQIVDLGTAGISIIAWNPGGPAEPPQNVIVNNNTLTAKTINGGCGIRIDPGMGITLTNNKVGPGVADAKSVLVGEPYSIDSANQNLTASNNIVE